MPSGEHESPIELAKLDPGLLVWLMSNLFDIDVPKYHHVRPHATDVRVVVPRTYHTDSLLLFCDEADTPVLAVVWEPQRDDQPDKVRTWKLYVAQFEKQLNVQCLLLVYCPSPAHARTYGKLIESDQPTSLPLRPYFVTPDDVPLLTDVETARAHPAVAVFSALCHSKDPKIDEMFPALTEALRILGPKRAIEYHDIVLAGLPMPARARWEAHMTTAVGHQYRSELFRQLAAEAEAKGEAEGRAKGEAAGEARAILTVLDVNGVAVPDDVRDRILACTDLDQLGTWLRRAVRATTVDDVLVGPEGT